MRTRDFIKDLAATRIETGVSACAYLRNLGFELGRREAGGIRMRKKVGALAGPCHIGVDLYRDSIVFDLESLTGAELPSGAALELKLPTFQSIVLYFVEQITGALEQVADPFELRLALLQIDKDYHAMRHA